MRSIDLLPENPDTIVPMLLISVPKRFFLVGWIVEQKTHEALSNTPKENSMRILIYLFKYCPCGYCGQNTCICPQRFYPQGYYSHELVSQITVLKYMIHIFRNNRIYLQSGFTYSHLVWTHTDNYREIHGTDRDVNRTFRSISCKGRSPFIESIATPSD